MSTCSVKRNESLSHRDNKVKSQLILSDITVTFCVVWRKYFHCRPKCKSLTRARNLRDEFAALSTRGSRIWRVPASGRPGRCLEFRCWQSEGTGRDHLKFSFYKSGKWSLKDTLSCIQSLTPPSHQERRPESPLCKPSVLPIALECLGLTYPTQWQRKTLFTDESDYVLDFRS